VRVHQTTVPFEGQLAFSSGSKRRRFAGGLVSREGRGNRRQPKRICQASPRSWRRTVQLQWRRQVAPSASGTSRRGPSRDESQDQRGAFRWWHYCGWKRNDLVQGRI